MATPFLIFTLILGSPGVASSGTADTGLSVNFEHVSAKTDGLDLVVVEITSESFDLSNLDMTLETLVVVSPTLTARPIIPPLPTIEGNTSPTIDQADPSRATAEYVLPSYGSTAHYQHTVTLEYSLVDGSQNQDQVASSEWLPQPIQPVASPEQGTEAPTVEPAPTAVPSTLPPTTEATTGTTSGSVDSTPPPTATSIQTEPAGEDSGLEPATVLLMLFVASAMVGAALLVGISVGTSREQRRWIEGDLRNQPVGHSQPLHDRDPIMFSTSDPVGRQRTPSHEPGLETVSSPKLDSAGAPPFVSGWFEKGEGLGEDSSPMTGWRADGEGLLGVCDGVGGAGSAKVATTAGNQTEARAAADLCRSVTSRWFNESGQGASATQRAHDLKSRLEEALAAATANSPASKLSGTLKRRWPTTLAAMRFEPSEGGHVETAAYWAGDSRCYVLQPHNGLRQLTRDHSRDRDALEQLTNDSPMSNVISADKTFRIESHVSRFSTPAVLIAATDGVFGYVKTPAHFEHLLLDTLMDCRQFEEWQDRLLDAVASRASDDASFAITLIGFSSFREARTAFTERHRFLEKNHVELFSDLEHGDHDGLVEARQRSWHAYRDLYEKALPAAPQEARR